MLLVQHASLMLKYVGIVGMKFPNVEPVEVKFSDDSQVGPPWETGHRLMISQGMRGPTRPIRKTLSRRAIHFHQGLLECSVV